MATVNYGTDASCVPDLASDGRTISGRAIVAENLLNRFRTPRGSLKDDLNFGHDLEIYLNEDEDPATIQGRATSNIQAEARKDERVLTAAANVTIAGGQMTVVLTVTDADGPFLLVFAANTRGVTLLQGPT